MRMNTFHLKLIALIAMVIDHIAYALIPNTELIWYLMRIVGRIAAPLFWFCFTEGYRHTSNKIKYATRLGFASIIMMFGNSIMHFLVGSTFEISPINPNMFFTLFFMLMAIECFDRSFKQCSIDLCYLPIGMLFCLIIGIYDGYGWIAVFSILCFYYIDNQMFRNMLFIAINTLLPIVDCNYLQFFAFLAILMIMNYNSEKPKHSMKWLFYWFYPIHLWVLMIVGHYM